MRNVIFAALTAGILAVLGAQPAQAVGTHHPFCLQGDEYPALSHCVFDNYGQCMATASGRFLTCIANPYYAGYAGPTDPHASRSRNRRLRSGYDQPY